ncbi:MAG: helix-turn-helix transcriptional regulator [Polyangiaceae bacterium]|nr:helix-turn-helix transcriptional regulator [Polyangiaceae bacterium]
MKNSFDLKSSRTRLSLTQAALADRLGRATNTIARWERGELAVPEDVRRVVEALISGPAARLPVPDVVTLDTFHSDIVAALHEHVDPAVFEECAANLLREQWPKLVPVPGGSDDGFDGAVAGDEGTRPWPLIVTTDRKPERNLSRSLKQAITKGHNPKVAIFATSRALTPGQRRKLNDAATACGVVLQQIYDRSWFAAALYRHPEWCNKLLGLTGTPDPLSRLPLLLRLGGTHEMLGRSSELAKARETESDVILLGGPGSGKTMLLLRLADDGYFLSDGDRNAVTNSIRRHSPRVVIVDDAHDNFTQFGLLVKLRRQLGAKFRIVVSAWPPYLEDLREHLPNAEVVSLGELDADVVADIVRSIVPNLPNQAIKVIVRQADGRPGLAATLAHMCIDGRYRDVMTGDAVYERLGSYVAKDRELLGCFAVAGDAGLQLEDAATFLGRPKDDVQRALTRLAAGGVIRVSGSRHFSVWPEQLRYVLVREVFFHERNGLDYEQLVAKVFNRSAWLRVLIGATRSGAQVPRLQDRLEEVNQVQLWCEYASLDPQAASYVLDKHPEMLVEAAPELLWHVPDRALSKLLDAAARGGAPSGRDAPALTALRTWLRDSSMDERVVIARSQEAAKQVLKWIKRNENHAGAIVFCIAMSPILQVTESDPGRGMTLTYRRGAVGDWGIGQLTALWDAALPDLMRARSLPWGHLLDLVNEWARPDGGIPITAEARRMMRDLACKMVRDVVPLAKAHPGAQRRLAEVARTLEISGEVDFPDVGADVGALFPRLDRHSVDDLEAVMKSHVKRVREWARVRIDVKDVGELVRSVLSLQQQLNEAKARSDNYVWAAFDEFARGTSTPTEWVDALVAERADPALVWPFVRRIIDEGSELATLLGLLKEDRYTGLLAEGAVMSKSAHAEVVEWVDCKAADYVEQISCQIRVGNVGDDRVLAFLHHRDPRVRAAIAVAYYVREKNPSDELGSAWRNAIIDTARVPELPSQYEYWLKQILTQNVELGSEWLKALLEIENDDLSFHDIGLEVADRLAFAAKADILHSAKFGVHQAEFLTHLVGGDPKLYEMLLERRDLAEYHLEPLACRSRLVDSFSGPMNPRRGWAELSAMALERGFSEDEVFRAILPRSWGFTGSEVPLWQGWRDDFEKFESHSEPAVRRVASRGKSEMDRRLAAARERERMDAVRGV